MRARSGWLLGFLFTPYLTIRPISHIRTALSAMPLERLVALLIGVFLGLIAAALFAIPLSQLPSPLKEILPLATALGFCYLGAVLMMNRYRDLREFAGGIRLPRGADKAVAVVEEKEDTNVILLSKRDQLVAALLAEAKGAKDTRDAEAQG